MYIHTLLLFLFEGWTVKAFWKNQYTFPLKHLSLGFVYKIGNQEGIEDNTQVVLEVPLREETWIGFFCWYGSVAEYWDMFSKVISKYIF